MWGSEDNLWKSILYSESWDLYSGCWAWQQASFTAETSHWLVPASFLRSEIFLTLELTLKARITDACYAAWVFMGYWVSEWSLCLYGMHYQLSCLPVPLTTLRREPGWTFLAVWASLEQGFPALLTMDICTCGFSVYMGSSGYGGERAGLYIEDAYLAASLASAGRFQYRISEYGM